MKNHGWETTIIAAATAHNSAEAGRSGSALIDGIRFLFVDTPDYSGNGAGRLRNMLAYSWRAMSAVRSLGEIPDAIIGSSVHPFAALAAERLARRYNVPFFFEVRDLWPETLIQMGRLKHNSPVAITMRRLEGYLYRRAARIITLLPRAFDYIGRFGIPAERVVWIPNGIDVERFGPVKPLPENSPFTFMYLGSMGEANGLDTLIQAMDGLPYRLRMIGDGALRQALIASAPANVSFEPVVPRDAVPPLAAEADAFVICVRDLPLYRYGISMNKLGDYLAAGRPTVIASGPSTTRFRRPPPA